MELPSTVVDSSDKSTQPTQQMCAKKLCKRKSFNFIENSERSYFI